MTSSFESAGAAADGEDGVAVADADAEAPRLLALGVAGMMSVERRPMRFLDVARVIEWSERV